jgi:glycine reductase complex component B subunit gamma
MAKEFERAGVPTVFISTIVPLAASIGPNRLVPGKSIPHPLGDPSLSREEEKRFRRRIVLRALEALQTDIAAQRVFEYSR